jgi:hypothetical protein
VLNKHVSRVLQVAILDLVRKVTRSDASQKGRCINIIIALMQSKSTAVTYECAVTLTQLSQAPTAVRAACQCFCQLLVSQSDNNVKLIVLDRLKVGGAQRVGRLRVFVRAFRGDEGTALYETHLILITSKLFFLNSLFWFCVLVVSVSHPCRSLR